ncbi:MAG: hypothetical protein AB1750_14090 [Chloroflexota bacterium]
MKHSLSRILLALPMLAALLAANWLVDPAHLRQPDAYERRIADMLAQGKAVTNVVNEDDSAILEFSILNQKVAPDLLLLGTSKSKVISSDFFPGRRFYNASLNGSGLDDLVVIYGLFERRGLIPREMILEVNPWLLTEGRFSQSARFAARGPTAVRSLQRGGPIEITDLPPNRSSWRAYQRFLTPDYFQSSSLALLDWAFNGNNGQPREFHEGDTPINATYLPDGSRIMPSYILSNLGSERPLAWALKYGWDPPGDVPWQIDPRQRKVLEAFVKHLADSGVKVTFYLGPYHPLSYRLMLDSPNRVVVDIQRYFIELAQSYGFTVIGSFNPADLGVTEADFYDVTHITPEATHRIFDLAQGIQ